MAGEHAPIDSASLPNGLAEALDRSAAALASARSTISNLSSGGECAAMQALRATSPGAFGCTIESCRTTNLELNPNAIALAARTTRGAVVRTDDLYACSQSNLLASLAPVPHQEIVDDILARGQSGKRNDKGPPIVATLDCPLQNIQGFPPRRPGVFTCAGRQGCNGVVRTSPTRWFLSEAKQCVDLHRPAVSDSPPSTESPPPSTLTVASGGDVASIKAATTEARSALELLGLSVASDGLAQIVVMLRAALQGSTNPLTSEAQSQLATALEQLQAVVGNIQGGSELLQSYEQGL